MPFTSWLVTFSAVFVILTGIFIYQLKDDFKPEVFEWKLPPKYENELRRNKALANEEILMKGDLQGPESIVVEGEIFYTGTSDGQFLRVEKDGLKKKVLTNGLSPSCILGLRRLNKDHLIAVDWVNGIFLVDFDKDKVIQVLSTKTTYNGHRIGIPNDLDVLNEDMIIFSDLCPKWDAARSSYCILEGAKNSRVYKFQLSSKKLEILLDGLYTANGVQILPDRQSLLVSEMAGARVTKYHISGPKQGQREIFADNLPGYPDNIRLSSTGTIFVPMGGVRVPEENSYLEMLGSYLWLRRMIVLPTTYLNSWVYTQLFSVKYGLVLEYALNGTLLRSLHDPCGVTDDGTSLYLGSFELDFIVKVNKTQMEEKLKKEYDKRA